MTAIPSIITDSSITVFVNNSTHVAKKGHPNFQAILDYLKAGQIDAGKLASMFDVKQAVAQRSDGLVTVSEDGVLYDGKPLHNTLTNRMVRMFSEGYNIDPLINFLKKLMQNPSNRAVNGLYDFLAATNIPITPNGNFLAFKKVRSDYLDIHSGTIRNAPGDAPRVNRNEVDENPDRTCSHGLHVCSESYLPHFGSSGSTDRVVIVEVDPADVVAIPRDYNNAKMRCCGYRVIGEVAQEAAPSAFKTAVVATETFSNAAHNTARLSGGERDVIKNIRGVPVRFVLETYSWNDDEAWVAKYTDVNGDSEEYDTETDDLEEAVEIFDQEVMQEVSDWQAELRWMNDDDELETITVRVDGVTEEPDTIDFLDTEKAMEIDSTDIRVKNIREVVGSRRWAPVTPW